MISVKLNEKNARLAASLMRFMPSQVQAAAVAAINRTITTTRKEISKAVRERYIIRAGDVKRALFTQKAKNQSLRGVITVKGTPLSLAKFRLRRRKRGPVRVQVLRGGSARPVKGLFVQRFPSGYEGPMHRRKRARYPLATPFGPSVPAMVGKEETLEQFVPKAEKTLNERFLHEIKWRLSKKLGVGKK